MLVHQQERREQDMFDITIAGEINMDLILYGLPEAMPVERETLASSFRMTLGSSSAILAHNLATLGVRVGFITMHGSDEMGRAALERLADGGVDLSCVVPAASSTPTGVTVLLHHGKTRHILTYPGTMNEMTRADLDFEYLASSRHFHLSSLFLQKGLQPGLPQLFRDLKARGLTLSLDTNDDPEDRWEGVLDQLLACVDILMPNESEICRIARCGTVEDSLTALAERVPLIVVKCGSRGAIVQHGAKRIVVPPLCVTPVDTIGAGDSFNAGFLAAFLNGAPAETCAQAGNVTGALSTMQPGGTEAFSNGQLRQQFLHQHWPVMARFPLQPDASSQITTA